MLVSNSLIEEGKVSQKIVALLLDFVQMRGGEGTAQFFSSHFKERKGKVLCVEQARVLVVKMSLVKEVLVFEVFLPVK